MPQSSYDMSSDYSATHTRHWNSRMPRGFLRLLKPSHTRATSRETFPKVPPPRLHAVAIVSVEADEECRNLPRGAICARTEPVFMGGRGVCSCLGRGSDEVVRKARQNSIRRCDNRYIAEILQQCLDWWILRVFRQRCHSMSAGETVYTRLFPAVKYALGARCLAQLKQAEVAAEDLSKVNELLARTTVKSTQGCNKAAKSTMKRRE